MVSEIIVAAIQFDTEMSDVFKNLKTAQQLVFEAAAKGARLIVLPELCASGYNIQNIREAADCSQTRDGYQTQALLPLAKKFNCHVVLGYVELFDGKFYNSAAVIGPRGVEANCRKHNSWGPDHMWATPSEDLHPVCVTAAGRTGVLICRDVMNNYRDTYKFHNPQHRFYKPGAVDTICLLTSWGADYGYPDAAWVELAEETDANVVVSNRVGTERDLKFKGGSCVIDRDLNVMTDGSSFTDAAVVGGVVKL